jgi:uncharacterized membrane protein YfhO
MTLESTTDADGLVVVSAVYDPDWSAYVGGKKAPVYATFRALRSVPVPAGTHIIEFRYAPPSLIPGLLISGATMATVGSALLFILWRRRTGRPLLVGQ